MEKRNPYLMDYEEQLRLREYSGRSSRREVGNRNHRHVQPRQQQTADLKHLCATVPASSRRAIRSVEYRRGSSRQAVDSAEYRPTSSRQAVKLSESRPAARRQGNAPHRSVPVSGTLPPRRPSAGDISYRRTAPGSSKAAWARARRRKIVRRQRLAIGIWSLCILFLAVVFLTRNTRVSAAQPAEQSQAETVVNDLSQPVSDGAMIQGLPVAVFSSHPYWKEDFLTPNEYSRPGDPLEEVTNLFVHYTANAGTSAAQNRSYFEWLKDTHENSVSAHFIIGYEGEIIQCVPLDEIAYAVQTRNMDSISIECCYQAADGSFTQETYDSLIGLLAWLTQVYGLDTDDILRHYDCGGKKCPIYYTEHEDAWEQLKADVAEKIGGTQISL